MSLNFNFSNNISINETLSNLVEIYALMAYRNIYNGYDVDNEDGDSDIEEGTYKAAYATKRRKSSPQLDPIPDYTPTPLHILEKRARLNPPTYSYSDNNKNLQYNNNALPTNKEKHIAEPPLAGTTQTTQQKHKPKTSQSKVSLFCPKPKTSSSAQPVACRRRLSSSIDSSSTNSTSKPTILPDKQANTEPHINESVMWTPRVPSEIPELKPKNSDDYSGAFHSLTVTKQRVAHKPTIAAPKSKKSQHPLGQSKNVPIVLRNRYLGIIIDEYLNTGHTEQESYDEARKEEQAIAQRASSKNIYLNLVAGLKKKIREKAGIPIVKTNSTAPCVSHDKILTGKVDGTFSIEKRNKNT